MFASVDYFLSSISVARCATWVTYALFSTCWWLVWVPNCRTLVVTTMVCFHLFVETLTNTYFLNSLLALGWLTFLVKPNASIRPVAPVDQIVATFFVLAVALVAFIDGFPLESMTNYFPNKAQIGWNAVVEYQYEFYNYIEPFLVVTGLWQGIWDLSSMHNPQERISFQAYLLFTDDSEYAWESPNFKEMNWLEKKQHGRVINYFAALPTANAAPAALKLCYELEKNYAEMGDMAACELIHRIESDPLPPKASSGRFEPAHDELERHYRRIVSVHFCVDQRDDCADMMEEDGGTCDEYLLERCARTCGVCTPTVKFASSQYYEPYKEDDADPGKCIRKLGAEGNGECVKESTEISERDIHSSGIASSGKENSDEEYGDEEYDDYDAEDEYDDEYEDEDDYDDDEDEYDDDEDEYDDEDEDEDGDYIDEDYTVNSAEKSSVSMNAELYGDNDDDENEYDVNVHEPSAAPSAVLAKGDEEQAQKGHLRDDRRAVTDLGNTAANGKDPVLIAAGASKKEKEAKDSGYDGTAIPVECEGEGCDTMIHMLLMARDKNVTDAEHINV